MTVSTARRRSPARRRTKQEVVPAPLPIGDESHDIFNCPACTRPLAVGVHRCPGCRTRLLLGVQLKRAGLFAAAGMVAGLALTTAFVVVSINVGLASVQAGRGAAVDPVATAGTGTTPVASAAAPSAPPASVAPVRPAIPSAAVTALSQTAQMNARLAAGIPTLQAALAQPTLDTFSVAEVFRSMTADAAYAAGAAERMGRWDDAADVAASLGAMYAEIRTTALDALSKSLTSDTAYRAAAGEMLGVLADLVPLDAASRDLAELAGIDLPPVDLSDLAPPADAG